MHVESAALRKWREDVELHRAHAEFARSVGSWGRLGRIFAEALQVHPKDESLWIEAASHEFFGPPSLQSDPNYNPDDPSDPRNAGGAASNLGGSVRSARVLLQRGLRANPTSRELWWQHFSLELHYVQKPRGRREILRLGLKGADGGGFVPEEEDGDGDGNEGGGGAVSDAVPLVVYRNAVEAVPDDVAFRLRFVDLTRQFPETGKLRDAIVRTVERDFAGSVEAWIARARYAAEEGTEKGTSSALGFLTAAGEEGDDDDDEVPAAGEGGQSGGGSGDDDDDKNEDPVHSVLLEAVRRVPITEMYLEAVRLVADRLRSPAGEDGDDIDDEDDDRIEDDPGAGGADDDARRRERDLLRDASFLGRLFDGASSAGVLGAAGSGADLLLARANYLLSRGDAKGAADSLRSACLGSDGGRGGEGASKGRSKGRGDGSDAAKGADARVWLRWADLLGRLESSSLSASASPERPPLGEGPEDVLRLALDRIPVGDPGHSAVAPALFRRLLLPAAPPSTGGGAMKKADRRARRRGEEASALLRRILILPNEDETAVDGRAELCLALLRAASLSGGIDAARAAYEPVLFRSGYAGSCAGAAGGEVRSMMAFFEACLCAEKSAAAAAKGGAAAARSEDDDSRRRVGRIYDAAIGFFREGGNDDGANYYRRRKGVDRALLG